MERLTDRVRNFDGTASSPKSLVKEEGMQKGTPSAYCSAIVTKLADYEDLEEQGLLLRLPCKVGDTLYQCHFINRQKIEREYKVIGLFFDIVRNVWLYEIAYQIGVEWRRTMCSFDAIGLTVFLTSEEAEQALEMQKG